MLQNFLHSIGLSDKESKVYLTLLQIGNQAVSIIANKSGLTRTTVYAVLESLEKKELVMSYEKNKILYYSAKSPHIIQQQLEEQSGKIRSQLDEFQNLLPQFLAMNLRGEGLPRVQYFEGLEGIKKIYEDTLNAEKEKLAYSSIPDIQNNELLKFINEYLKKRSNRKIKVRAIMPNTPNSRQFIENDLQVLRETRLVPQEKFPFRSEVNIYNNKMAIMSLQSDILHGVLIESEAIASTEKSVFELAWLGAGKVMKN